MDGLSRYREGTAMMILLGEVGHGGTQSRCHCLYWHCLPGKRPQEHSLVRLNPGDATGPQGLEIVHRGGGAFVCDPVGYLACRSRSLLPSPR